VRMKALLGTEDGLHYRHYDFDPLRALRQD
jgi:hypothetical protein